MYINVHNSVIIVLFADCRLVLYCLPTGKGHCCLCLVRSISQLVSHTMYMYTCTYMYMYVAVCGWSLRHCDNHNLFMSFTVSTPHPTPSQPQPHPTPSLCLCPLTQLFREVRIMKYLDHPNIGNWIITCSCLIWMYSSKTGMRALKL